jgi:hypothetical protein
LACWWPAPFHLPADPTIIVAKDEDEPSRRNSFGKTSHDPHAMGQSSPREVDVRDGRNSRSFRPGH